MFANYLQNVGSILKFVAQNERGCVKLAPLSYFAHSGQGNDLQILETTLQMFANYLQNECITLKKIGHGGGANFTHINNNI
ncbi:hypothetical protein FWK35_00019093 [Aphis craccivora]|uniref:Uncharacterized protein n=1 Tax=Aphis craccivora TaxID=307492 RepID=A0A6G0Y268_APHCR|nr:hypothetical protein FWK35_00019093 [Aphis craccivora]